MESLQKSLIGIIVASLALYGLWYFYADRFNIGLFQNETSCKETLTTAETKVMKLIDEKSTAIITGTSPTAQPAASVATMAPLPTITGLESIQKLLNVDALVDSAVARIRSSLAEKQASDPTSIVNTEKARIHSLFETARGWCSKIPFGKTKATNI